MLLRSIVISRQDVLSVLSLLVFREIVGNGIPFANDISSTLEAAGYHESREFLITEGEKEKREREIRHATAIRSPRCADTEARNARG